MLKKSFKYQLKAKAHALKPVVLLGAKGLTPAVIQETEQTLLANELIKIKLTGVDRKDKIQVIDTLCVALQAEFIQLIGNIATLYRPHPEQNRQPVKATRQGTPRSRIHTKTSRK